MTNMTEIDKDELQGVIELLDHDRAMILDQLNITKKQRLQIESVERLDEVYSDLTNIIQGFKQLIE